MSFFVEYDLIFIAKSGSINNIKILPAKIFFNNPRYTIFFIATLLDAAVLAELYGNVCVNFFGIVFQNPIFRFHRWNILRLQRNNEKLREKSDCGSHANNRSVNKNIQENAMTDIFVIESIHGFITSVRRSDKQTLAVIVHIISIVKKRANDGQSCILITFGIKKQKSTLAIIGIANIVTHKKINA